FALVIVQVAVASFSVPVPVSVMFSNDVHLTVPLCDTFVQFVLNVDVCSSDLSLFELPVAVVKPFQVPVMPVLWFAAPLSSKLTEIGRASCRERVGIAVAVVPVKIQSIVK